MIDRSYARVRTDYDALVSRINYFEQEWERLNRELGQVRHAAGKEESGRFALRKLHRDMRTLLGGIIGLTEMMRYGMTGPVTEAQKEHLGEVYKSAWELRRMINDLIRSFE